MFDSLDSQMKADESKAVSAKERAVKWFVGAILAVAIFGGLYLSVHLLQG